MLYNGHCIIVKDYKAEIVEFNTVTVIRTPDGGNKYLVATKYGEEYFNEDELSQSMDKLTKDCNALNEALQKVRGNNGTKRSLNKR